MKIYRNFSSSRQYSTDSSESIQSFTVSNIKFVNLIYLAFSPFGFAHCDKFQTLSQIFDFGHFEFDIEIQFNIAVT
jgi:hypothetical protein